MTNHAWSPLIPSSTVTGASETFLSTNLTPVGCPGVTVSLGKVAVHRVVPSSVNTDDVSSPEDSAGLGVPVTSVEVVAVGFGEVTDVGALVGADRSSRTEISMGIAVRP